uniref:Secreted protein n=1 Tax=Anopheles minimus TaxID=112268 RepID=A0A182W293_9DIPT
MKTDLRTSASGIFLMSAVDSCLLLLVMVRNAAGADDSLLQWMVRLSAAVIRVSCAHRNQVLVQGDGLVEPLPSLVQRVDAVSNTYTIATAVKGHSFQLARREDEMGLLRTAVYETVPTVARSRHIVTKMLRHYVAYSRCIT